MSIEGSYIVPRESFVGVCKETKELADLMLALAVAMTREQQLFAEDSKAIKIAMQATSQLRFIESLLRAIMEENGGPPFTNGAPVAGGEDPDEGGQACAGG